MYMVAQHHACLALLCLELLLTMQQLSVPWFAWSALIIFFLSQISDQLSASAYFYCCLSITFTVRCVSGLFLPSTYGDHTCALVTLHVKQLVRVSKFMKSKCFGQYNETCQNQSCLACTSIKAHHQ